MESTVSSKGQVTIPKPIRDALGLYKGTRIVFEERDGEVVISRSIDDDPVSAIFGILQNGRNSDDIIRELRDGDGNS